MVFLILFIVSCLCAWLGAAMASNRRREPVIWGIACFCTGIIGIIVLALLGDVPAPVRDPYPADDLGLRPLGDHRPQAAAYVAPTPEPTGAASLKWRTLLDVDKEVQAAASEVCPLGRKYEDELADKFIVLMDESYLPAIVQNLKEKAKGEQDALAVSLDDYRKAVARNSGKEPTYGKPVVSSDYYNGVSETFRKGLRVILDDGGCVLVSATGKRIFKDAAGAEAYTG